MSPVSWRRGSAPSPLPTADCFLPTGLCLAGALGRCWQVRGAFGEGRRYLMGVVAAAKRAGLTSDARTVAPLAKALSWAGFLAVYQGEYVTARALCEESLALWREVGDRRCLAITLNSLGMTRCTQGDTAAARPLLEESLRLAWEIGDRRSIAYSLEAFARLQAARGERPERAARLYGAAAALREVIARRCRRPTTGPTSRSSPSCVLS